jgi:hypothetical protein
MRRQKIVKNKLMEMVGPFPEKTPLNAKITGTIKSNGYRVEKIVYESMPGFYVTGCLYIPEGLKGKAPAILNVIGHNQDAFRMELYQLINYNLAIFRESTVFNRSFSREVLYLGWNQGN